MTAIPDKSLLDSEVRTGSAKTQVIGPIFDVLAESLGGAAVSELTISAGSITPTGASHTVDTGGDAETDYLTNIAYTNHPDGRIIILSCANDSREVVLKHGAGGDGQLLLRGGVDLTLSDTDDTVFLQRRGTTWVEIIRSMDGTTSIIDGMDAAAARTALGLAIGTDVLSPTGDGSGLSGIKQGRNTDIIVTVGTGGDFATINEALAALDAVYYPVYVNGGFTAEIQLLAGFVMVEQVFISNKDLSWITITSVDASVTIQRSSLTTSTDVFGTRYPAFWGANAGMPTIDCLFTMDTTGTSNLQCGLLLSGKSHIYFLEGNSLGGAGSHAVGIKNSTSDNVILIDISTMSAKSCDFSDSGGPGVNANGLILARVRLCDLTNCSTYGVLSSYGAKVESYGSDATGSGTYGYRVTTTGTIIAPTATGTLSQTANTWTSNGYIQQ